MTYSRICAGHPPPARSEKIFIRSHDSLPYREAFEISPGPASVNAASPPSSPGYARRARPETPNDPTVPQRHLPRIVYCTVAGSVVMKGPPGWPNPRHGAVHRCLAWRRPYRVDQG
jgi:hypothetical protein